MTEKRTLQQNKALHLYCELIAQELNNAGYDVKAFYDLTDGKLDISWNKELVKERLWRPYQIAISGEEKTSHAGKMFYPEIYRELDMRISELTGVHVEWPSEETLNEKG